MQREGERNRLKNELFWYLIKISVPSEWARIEREYVYVCECVHEEGRGKRGKLITSFIKRFCPISAGRLPWLYSSVPFDHKARFQSSNKATFQHRCYANSSQEFTFKTSPHTHLFLIYTVYEYFNTHCATLNAKRCWQGEIRIDYLWI